MERDYSQEEIDNIIDELLSICTGSLKQEEIHFLNSNQSSQQYACWLACSRTILNSSSFLILLSIWLMPELIGLIPAPSDTK